MDTTHIYTMNLGKLRIDISKLPTGFILIQCFEAGIQTCSMRTFSHTRAIEILHTFVTAYLKDTDSNSAFWRTVI